MSNQDKYKPSLEQQVFMAENPDLKGHIGVPTFDYLKSPYSLYDPALANTNDTDHLARLLDLQPPNNHFAT